MIYRIDPELAFRQGLWVVVGVAVFAGLVLFLRDYRQLDNVKYILGVSAIVLLVLPAPTSAGRSTARRSGSTSAAGSSSSPASWPKVSS